MGATPFIERNVILPINIIHKRRIVRLFINNIKGRTITPADITHDGSEGHWLETRMGIARNNKNEPDIHGYEMKKQSKKITFGDFSATEYLFSKNRAYINAANYWQNDINITRTQFITYFGTPNPLKDNRYSWSGRCVPTYNNWNTCGQNMIFNDAMDLCIYYDHSKDTRQASVPDYLRAGRILIAVWRRDKLKSCVEKKFGVNGFFICSKSDGVYDKIRFGDPFNFEYFAENIKKQNIIFDSGMYVGNSRNYSQFRSSADNFWNLLITDTY